MKRINTRLDENFKPKNTKTKTKTQRRETLHTTNMSPKESHIKMSLEPRTTSTLSTSSTKSTPSTAPTMPAVEEEKRHEVAHGDQKPHPLSPLEREYDPSRDNLPIDELLARPRLPRSPCESYQKSAMNGRTMKPLGVAVSGESGASGEDARRGEEFEIEKERLRALGVEMAELEFPKKE